MVDVKIYMENGATMPNYATEGASGMDVYANERVVIPPRSTRLVKTDLYFRLPPGYEFQVRPRSGLSLKTSLRIANTPGTIDEDYTGEVCIIAENTNGSIDFSISKGERIAQLVLCEVPKVNFIPVSSREELGDTVRAAGGFGSTGL